MDKSLPPLPVVQVQDITLKEIMSTSDVYEALIQQLQMKEVQANTYCQGFDNLDDFLMRKLVNKLDIKNCDEGYEPISILGMLCFLALYPILIQLI
jgi:transglutaminase/protease-like cytokinesis protein 3